MKFLLIASDADSLINFRGALLDALVVQGADVHVAAPDLSPQSLARARLEAKGLQVHDIQLQRVGMNPLTDLRSCYSLWSLMRQIRPNWVLSYTVKPVIYGMLAARAARVPNRFALITGLGYAFQGQETGGFTRKSIHFIVKSLYRLALNGCHKVFFQNPDDQALFKQLKLVNSSTPTVAVNGSGVDIAQFSVQDIPQPVSFLLIARFLGDKGVREYAAAAREVKKLHPHTVFNMVGWIDDNPDAINKSELDAWQSEGDINYLGRLADVRPAIINSSVYVLPSYREGTPRTVLEAMAMGRPVITTDAPGCRETVENGVNGFLVPVKSVEKLVEAMTYFISHPDTLKVMGAASRHIAEKKYDVHSVNEVMLKEMKVVSRVD